MTLVDYDNLSTLGYIFPSNGGSMVCAVVHDNPECWWLVWPGGVDCLVEKTNKQPSLDESHKWTMTERRTF